MGTWCTEGVKRTKLEYQRIESTKRRRITIAHQAERIEQLQAEFIRLNIIIDNRAEDLEIKAKYEQLQAENKQLKQDLSDSEDNAHELQGCYDEMLPLCKQAKQLQAKIDELKKALEKYSVHKDDCNLMLNEHLSVCDSKCTCGFDQALQNTNTDGATGGGRDVPLKENKE
ncbi:hypothetical protein LCGC14_1317030 [marine sediment metagenome]|uniref:Uncharacterized protein n=1 Tax=marine sediment metagenome TaxID=412755 RepID=A0A0F9L5X7_9ZZZZ